MRLGYPRLGHHGHRIWSRSKSQCNLTCTWFGRSLQFRPNQRFSFLSDRPTASPLPTNLALPGPRVSCRHFADAHAISSTWQVTCTASGNKIFHTGYFLAFIHFAIVMNIKSGLTGLAIWSFMPTAKTFSLSPFIALAVNAIIGKSLNFFCSRIWRVAS